MKDVTNWRKYSRLPGGLFIIILHLNSEGVKGIILLGVELYYCWLGSISIYSILYTVICFQYNHLICVVVMWSEQQVVLWRNILVLLVTVPASGRGVVENSLYWRQVNFSSCVTGLDTGVTCDLATFPSSPANIIKDVNYCCNNPLTFQEFGVCGAARQHFNVPVCHSYSSALTGRPDRFRKIDLQCADNSSLVVFDELLRTDMNCLLDEFMKEDLDHSKYCLRFVGQWKVAANSADIAVSTVPPSTMTGGGASRPVWSRRLRWTGSGSSVVWATACRVSDLHFITERGQL